MKKILVSLAVLILILAGGLYFALGNLDSIIQEQVEVQGTKALKTPVTLKHVKFDLIQGIGELDQFSIANPDSFSDQSAISFGKIRVDIDPESLRASPIVIEEILLDSVAALYEVDGEGVSNLDKLLEAVTAGSQETSTPTGTTSSESDIKLRINKLTVRDTQLSLNLAALGGNQIDQTLPSFEVRDIGGKQGLPPEKLGAEIGNLLVRQFTSGATQAAVQLIDPALLKNANKYATSTIDRVGKNLKEAGKNLEKGAKQVGKEIMGVLDGLGN